VPEVLQSSLMDCGPAALKAVLEGFGIQVGYDEVRARCQTDVDGTSLDALAALGNELGLHSQQILVPNDHVLLPEAQCLPAIVVTRGPGGLLHFCVVWRRLGPLVEVMDPGSGRHWLRAEGLLRRLASFPLTLSATSFRRWAGTATARRAWLRRLAQLRVSRWRAQRWLDRAGLDPTWRSLARFDAALRMTSELVRGGAFRRGREAEALLQRLMPPDSPVTIPQRLMWIEGTPGAPEQLVARGCVLVHFSAGPRRAASASASEPQAAERCAQRGPSTAGMLSSSVATELQAQTLRPLRALGVLLLERAASRLPWLCLAVCASAALLPLEALLLRWLVAPEPGLSFLQRAESLSSLLAFVAGTLLLELWAARCLAALGRELETQIRAALLERLPALDDVYLRSRSSSDMANRVHSLHLLRNLPTTVAQLARAALAVPCVVATLIWLHPEGWLPSLALCVCALVAPFLARRSLFERGLRLQTQSAALDGFYLDTLLGAAPVRVHGAERAIACAHEQLLTDWAGTARGLHTRQVALQSLQLITTSGLAIWLVLSQIWSAEPSPGALVSAFLALRLPVSAGELAAAQFALRNLRGVALRVLAPLAAPLEGGEQEEPTVAQGGAAQLQFERVTALAGGHCLLREIDLTIAPGSHVGIVGASGAGKSSLLGLLLGWLRPAEGVLRVDGRPLDLQAIRALRGQTAWVDPAIQLWDRSLLDNLSFGDEADLARKLPHALSGAQLTELLERLPEGLQAQLGEGGRRVSGGQGQRVRLGRAWLRVKPRLVLLDEPFRGLERAQRQELLRRAREHWRDATLLLVSHDVDDTEPLDHVVVLDGGRIVEQGAPSTLLARPASRYAQLHARSRAARGELWGAALWRRLRLQGGTLEADGAPVDRGGS
jgi:ATP-binding cassette subfamily B protein